MRRALLLTVIATLLTAPVAVASNDGPIIPGVDDCDWVSFRNGPRNPGASTCDGIGPLNVATLVPKFLYRTRDSVTSTPAVVDGVLYVGTWDGWFYAFDTRGQGLGDPSFEDTGLTTVEPMWEHQIDDTNDVAFGRIVSSPSVVDIGGTRVVVFGGGATVYALDATNGDVLAQLCLDPRTTNRCQGSDHDIEVESSPVVVRHPDGSVRVVVGLDVHNASGVGRTGVVKLRLKNTADGRWSFTPEWKFDPEAGEVYTGPGLLTRRSGTGWGCGGVWGTPAVDVDADLVVFGTSSCSSSSSGAPDVGEKVFAVRYGDGSERWRFSPHRPWGAHVDDDFGAAVQLFEIPGELSDKLVAGAGGKDGWYYALDAMTGEEAWKTQVGQSGHLSVDFAVGGILGSPAVGEIDDAPAIFVTTAISTPFGAPLDEPSPQTIDGSLAADPGRMLSLHAVDASTGDVLWRQPLTRQTYGHPTYANGVVFVPSTVGLSVQAFEADTGTPLWTSPTLNGAPSSGVAVTRHGIYVGAGTRQTDAGFKLTGEGSVVPEALQQAVPPAIVDVTGSDPQERASGIWGFAIVRR